MNMPTEMDTPTLFAQYLNVANAALSANEDRFPYKQILRALSDRLNGKRVGVAVYKDDSSSPFDYFTITFHDGHLSYLAHGKEAPDIVWKAPRRHLERVVRDPKEYIEHPAKLDWDWLKSRAGVS